MPSLIPEEVPTIMILFIFLFLLHFFNLRQNYAPIFSFPLKGFKSLRHPSKKNERFPTRRVCCNDSCPQNKNNEMKMKRTTIASGMLLLALSLRAQQPQEIRGIVEETHDSAWYAGQIKAWEQVVAQDSLNEKAWRNLFEAARGLQNRSSQTSSPLPHIMQRMKDCIPDTYTYNICAYRAQQGPDNPFAEKALTLLPDSIEDRGYDAMLGYLWMMGHADGHGARADLFNDILHRQYAHGKYPSFMLRFDYNQLQGMEQGSLFFGNGDADLFGKVMLQRATGTHTDKVLVVLPMLYVRHYRDSLCQRLGIPPFTPRQASAPEAYDQVLQEMVEYLIHRTGRTAYFSPGSEHTVKSISRKLYNEGLVFRYSEQPYDNIAAAKRHVEQDYHFDYLTEPSFRPEVWWSGSEHLQLNYVVMLAPLVQSYRKEGRTRQADRLYRILQASVENGKFATDTQRTYLDYLEKWR